MWDNGVYIPAYAVIPWEDYDDDEEDSYSDFEIDDMRDRDACQNM